jgi:UDP-N-acetylglucosamine--N-acetylmuramyl-(pentapeptide) pyrophosphoryl-undecaprenol N-acetylglucosamine transferase
MEQAIVERESTLPFRAIRAAAVRSRGPLQLVRSAGEIAAGMRQARRLLREERPVAILGTGGYVCVPLFLAARAARVPTMIFLPDIVPGLAVRALAPLATRVACAFEPALRFLPRGKTVVTGYPLRPGLGTLDPDRCRRTFGLRGDLPVLLVYGGSRGARSINRAVEQLLDPLLRLSEIIHVCGREGDETFLREAAERLPDDLRARYHLHPYLQGTMPEALTAADLAICRAGASTLAELPAAGLPAVLVPLLVVHQDKNATYLSDAGAAVTVADTEMLGPGNPVDGPLFRAVERLLTHPETLAAMAARGRALARPDAADRLADAWLALAG